MYNQLDTQDGQLIEAAQQVLERCYRPVKHTVGAAVRAGSGAVYAAVNVEACGYAPCAETIALGMAFSNAETQVISVVAVNESGAVLSPCGNCRQMMLDYAPDALVILSNDGAECKTEARNLLPGCYVSDFE